MFSCWLHYPDFTQICKVARMKLSGGWRDSSCLRRCRTWAVVCCPGEVVQPTRTRRHGEQLPASASAATESSRDEPWGSTRTDPKKCRGAQTQHRNHGEKIRAREDFTSRRTATFHIRFRVLRTCRWVNGFFFIVPETTFEVTGRSCSGAAFSSSVISHRCSWAHQNCLILCVLKWGLPNPFSCIYFSPF